MSFGNLEQARQWAVDVENRLKRLEEKLFRADSLPENQKAETTDTPIPDKPPQGA